jgi:hypothetical protein
MTTLIVCLCLGFAPLDNATTPAPETREESSEATAAATFARQEAPNWKLTIETVPPQKLDLRSDPVLRWSNPAVGRVYGSVFLWTAEGRPIAAASIYRWFAPYTQRTAEFVLLSPHTVVAEREGRKLWTPAAGQVAFQPLDNAPSPDAASKMRLAQMRRLAGEFVPELTDKRVVGEGTEQQLRLLDKPIYQYGAGPEGLVEGALFAFVVGTDPEVLLLIEARETEGKSGWHYALARMNRDAMRVRRNDREVWKVPHLEKPWANPRDHYFLCEISLLSRQANEP